MEKAFQVDHLDVERLMASWRWLCPDDVTLVTRSVFGDLFLRNKAGEILWLDVTLGELTKIAGSDSALRDLLQIVENREKWLGESDARSAAENGLNPNADQCIGFATPLIAAESGYAGNAYVTDLYDHVGFLGDFHKQISGLPDGTKIRLVVKPRVDPST